MAGIGQVANKSVSTSTTSLEVLPATRGGLYRTQMILTNTSAAAIITICKGDVAAIADAGIRLLPNSTYVETSDTMVPCWQGAVQAVSDVNGTLAVVEQQNPIR